MEKTEYFNLIIGKSSLDVLHVLIPLTQGIELLLTNRHIGLNVSQLRKVLNAIILFGSSDLLAQLFHIRLDGVQL